MRNVITFLLAALCLSALSSGPLLAQSESADGSGEAKRPSRASGNARPEFRDPEVDPKLPNVLLIGDSISIGYTIPVREALEGEANVFRPATNCGPTTRGIEQLDQWLGDRQWDVIHFNFGLHDMKYMGSEGDNLANPNDPESHQQVPLLQYTANLKRIAERLKETGAIVVWCPTTPIPEGAKGRVPGDEVRYNRAAAEALTEVGGIEFSELYSHAVKNVLTEQRKADVHFTERGSKLLAEHVADTIRRALAKRQDAQGDKSAQRDRSKLGNDKREPVASGREVTGDPAATDTEATRPEVNDNEPE